MTSKSTNATLVIKSKQILQGELNQNELVYEGTVYNLGDKVTVFYDESKTGLGDTKSSIQYEDGRLVLKRKGAYAANIIFIEGESLSFAYRTPYGIIPMEVTTKALRVINSSHFKAHIEYDLITGDDISENVIDIYIK